MNCEIETQVNPDKAIALIAFSKDEIRNLCKKMNIENQTSFSYWEHWDFEQKALCHFQTSANNHVFLYQVSQNNESKLVIKALHEIVHLGNEKQISELQIALVEPDEMLLSLLAKEIFLMNYAFDKYKQKKNKHFLQKIQLILPDNAPAKTAILQESKTLAEAIMLTRDLVNEPSNVMYPETLAEQCVKLGKEAGFRTTILDEKEIEDLEMDAFLAVARGSQKPPRLIVLKYEGNPSKPNQILGLVGKGLTYDSGGYSIKSTEGMFNMKADMAGAASVIGTMYAISKQKLSCNVTAVIAACENLISGNSYKPGDVISSMAKKSIEIGNTDAEGRLTLIDAICYAIQEQKVTSIIDVATLTGAVVVALGMVRTGVISNNDSFYQELEQATKQSQERFWRLPHDDEYKELLKSEIADISNTGGRMAGSIAAGMFIHFFLPKEIPWLHLDIAGTSFFPKQSAHKKKGASGVPVSTLYYLIKNRN